MVVTLPGRNALCPCGSGQKFKKCCLPAIQSSPRVEGFQTFPERFVIGGLFDSSREFNTFFHAERPKIASKLHWAHDPGLPVGIEARVTLTDGLRIVRLRRIPAAVEDAFRVAHEIEHLVLSAQGFIIAGAPPGELERLSSQINSLPHDLLVDSILTGYGFDLWPPHEREVDSAMRQLTNIGAAPTDRLTRVLWIVEYASNLLGWELACSRSGERPDRFRTFFGARFPDVVREAMELVALVKSVGYDTPPKMHRLLTEIIGRYGLTGVMAF